MLAITVTLLNKQKVTAQELAEKFEVSIRTIYRDIDAINQAGIPIVSHQGNNGGFEIMDNYKIDRQVLTLKDISSILFALKGINSTLEDKDIDSVYNKINSIVSQNESKKISTKMDQIVIDFLPWGYGVKHKSRIKEIHQAIINTRRIEFAYQNSKGEKTKRSVEPMNLLFKGSSWYLFGYCLLKNDARLFRLSRIKDLVTLDLDFERKEISYQSHYQDKESIKTIDLVLKFSPHVRAIVEEYIDDEQITIDKNGYLTVKVTYPENDWIYSNILSYGEHVEVLKPERIKKIILKKAKKIIEKYQT